MGEQQNSKSVGRKFEKKQMLPQIQKCMSVQKLGVEQKVMVRRCVAKRRSGKTLDND